MPVHNGARYLNSAIESVLCQTFSDFEFIIVNDGSSDLSGEILENWARKDARVHILTQEERQGLPRTLNYGLRKCRGELIARMDGDDWCLPTRFSQQVDYMDRHPEIVACGAQALLIDPESRPICPSQAPEQHEAIDAMLLQGIGSAIFHPLVMMRKTALESIAGYNEQVELEDLDLFLRLAEIGRLSNLPILLLHYRLHLKSTNHQRREIHAKCAMETVAAAIKRRGLEQSLKVPQKTRLDDTLAGIYLDWAYKAFLGGNPRTGWVHCLNLGRASLRKPSYFQDFLKLAVFGLKHRSSKSA